MQRLVSYRSEFPILERKVYLNSCSLGALPRAGMAAVQAFLDEWAMDGAAAWERWLKKLTRLREFYAKLLGVTPPEIAIVPSVSGALSAIASCLDYRARPRVVSSDLDFPTLLYQWQAKAPAVQLVRAATPDGVRIPLEEYEQLIDDRTALVAVSHVLYSSHWLQDISALARMAHARGAYLLVDVYHSAGVVPVDLIAMGADFAVGGSLKWLCGGPGTAFLYVRRDLVQALFPTVTGWLAHADPFAFSTELDYAPDAARFHSGSPAVGSIYAAHAGLEIILEAGVAAIRDRVADLTDYLTAECLDRGWILRSPLDRAERGGAVFIQSDRPAALAQRLLEDGIVVDARGPCLRVSPHFYNTPGDLEALVNSLAQ
ncbi:MAG: aminotransferase class V-fold PLP-dependent enzyme [bacterium]|nr:aminotransferase class V-fold PLP-dependent enzyme [bacterium]